jgi:hypothetical protein
MPPSINCDDIEASKRDCMLIAGPVTSNVAHEIAGRGELYLGGHGFVGESIRYGW